MSKKALGIWSFLPLVTCVLGIGLYLVGMALWMEDDLIFLLMIPASILICVSALSVIIVMMLLLIWAGKRPYITYEEMVTWGLLFYFFNIITFPIFWSKYIKSWTEDMDTSYVRPEPPKKKNGVYYTRPGEEVRTASEQIQHVQEKEKKNKGMQILSLLPGIFTIITLVSFMGVVHTPEEIENLFLTFIFLLAVISHFVAAVIFTVHVWKNKQLGIGMKIWWTILFFQFSEIACLIYWFEHINCTKRPQIM